MAFDEELADRVRRSIDDVVPEHAGEFTERRMFGGLAFLLRGHMAMAVSGDGDGIMVRVGADAAPALLAATPAAQVVMGDRTMTGWLDVADTDLATDEVLDTWVRRGVEFAATLPPKG